MSLNASRTRRRKMRAVSQTSGITAKVTSASRQSIASIIPMMAISVKASPKIVTTPEENSSFSVSTSEVTRVISRPTGLRSKYWTLSRCRWAKISIRRSYMTRCPMNVVSSAPAYSTMNSTSIVPKYSAASRPSRPTSRCGIATSSACSVKRGPMRASPRLGKQQESARAVSHRYGRMYRRRRRRSAAS